MILLFVQETSLLVVDHRLQQFVEASKEMSAIERATTYRKNVRLWCETRPLSRLWVLKHLIEVQQRHQKDKLKVSGDSFELKQRDAHRKGKQRKYRIVMALDGEMTDGAMRACGQLLVSESAWEDLPVEFRDQSISCAGFRSTSKSICSLFESEVVRSRMCPFPYFGSVMSDTAEALRWARRVVKDFKDRPCVFDFWSYHETSQYPSVPEFLSPEHQAKQ